MELIPENLDGAVVFNVINSCGVNKATCTNCADFAVAIHNWLMGTNVRYVIIDLQDEKEVCPAFIEEVLQLAKRLRYPFLFAGVMDKPRRILESYDFLSRFPAFVTPEDAIAALEERHPGMTKVKLEGVEFGAPIAVSRSRNPLALDDAGEQPDAAAE